jgi:HAD superfamily hydrolase (TIGR01509 family)
LPGVIQLLKSLHDGGYTAAVGSSAPLKNIRIILEELGIGDLFQAIVYGREVKEGKPSPQIFLMAARKLKVEPVNCIVIEDSIAGVSGAKRAGMSCIAVTTTHPPECLKEADLIVSTLENIAISDLDQLIAHKKQ